MLTPPGWLDDGRAKAIPVGAETFWLSNVYTGSPAADFDMSLMPVAAKIKFADKGTLATVGDPLLLTSPVMNQQIAVFCRTAKSVMNGAVPLAMFAFITLWLGSGSVAHVPAWRFSLRRIVWLVPSLVLIKSRATF